MTCIIGTSYNNTYLHALSDYARERHAYVIGKTGAGKTTLLLNMIGQDLAEGRGVCVIDPHGDLARSTLSLIPTSRAHELVYIDPADTSRPVGFNPLTASDPDRHAFVASNVVAAFKHIWTDAWGPRLEHLLFNGVLTLLHANAPNLIYLERLYTDPAWRRRLLATITDPILLSFWKNQFDAWGDNLKAEALSPLLNKTGRFTQDPYVRNVIAQTKPAFDLARSMDEGRIVVINLAKGAIGELPSALLGAFFVTALAQAAYRRDRLAPEHRRSFTVYADELQNYATDSFAAILSEARKYRLHLVLSHQYLEQLPHALQPAILGNVGTLVALRISANDAETIARHLDLPVPNILNELPNHQAYYKTLDAHGTTVTTSIDLALPPSARHARSHRLVQNSRIRWGRDRATVDRFVISALT
jgi:type IV secretory pathway TraG/TraD family ATPase VirD4